MSAKILVVEDNPTNMKLVSMVLEHAGYEVLRAENAADGLALARARSPRIVLMDIQLPGIDGLEAARILKGDSDTQGIKVFALTAFAMKGDEERVFAAGCDGYFTKPIDYKQFLARIASCIAEEGA